MSPTQLIRASEDRELWHRMVALAHVVYDGNVVLQLRLEGWLHMDYYTPIIILLALYFQSYVM